ncbi:carboxypeptidase regulatory-like domain-containing protein [bacterium]|nr:carboxypeptidase regulatory-like domain-containing protein [bacterium]
MRKTLLLLLLPLGLAGCGGADGGPKTAVSGKVTLKGKPVSGAVVQFVPTAKGEAASARTDGDGKYQLVASKGGTGVAPGDYKVVISKVVGPDGKELPPDVSPFSGGGKETLPAMYSNPGDTILVAKVPDAPTASVDFPLTGQGGAATGFVPGAGPATP